MMLVSRRSVVVVAAAATVMSLFVTGTTEAFTTTAAPARTGGYTKTRQRSNILPSETKFTTPTYDVFRGFMPSADTTRSSTRLSMVSPSMMNSLLTAADVSTASAATSTTASSWMDSPLMMYFLQTLISNGVPALFTIIVIAFAAKMFSGGGSGMRGRGRKDGMFADFDYDDFDNYNSPAAALYKDLYKDQAQPSQQNGQKQFMKLFGGGGGGRGRGRGGFNDDDGPQLPVNIGIPKEQYIQMTNINDKYNSYKYSIMAATKSKVQAASMYRQLSFEQTLKKAFPALTQRQWRKLEDLETRLLKDSLPLVETLLTNEKLLVQMVADSRLKELGLESVYQLNPATTTDITTSANETEANGANATTASSSSSSSITMSSSMKGNKEGIERQIGTVRKQLEQMELEFIGDILEIIGPEYATSVRTAYLGDVATRGLGRLLTGDLQERPLTQILKAGFHQAGSSSSEDSSQANGTPLLYVARFPGDPTASQVATLREEITAILQSATPNVDECMIVLQTGGGTVTGYGLAAAQLQRLKNAGIKLTVAVEQVAASGGYMMCCVADRIIASPFAVLGSIGVISDIPNFYERLKTEGIEFQTVTAGKYKRTLTPTKKVTKDDLAKSKQDIEEIYLLFRDFVAANRPSLDIDSVATGETWFGEDALKRNLCDEIKTVDDVLMDYVARGYDVYEVEYKPPIKSPLGKLLAPVSAAQEEDRGLIGGAVRWLVKTVASEIKTELNREFGNVAGGVPTSLPPIQERYMAKNDDADSMRSEA